MRVGLVATVVAGLAAAVVWLAGRWVDGPVRAWERACAEYDRAVLEHAKSLQELTDELNRTEPDQERVAALTGVAAGLRVRVEQKRIARDALRP